ncbi:MAG TPA: fibronectin type III domain-containing protein, partial [Bacillota bacterium]|nr:fibronectin type III domain-containing protein [Bacillota bacterium]
DPVARIKHLIQAQYRAAPREVKCVFLFGHVPVAYSGSIMPDGHGPDHQGAWPCDGYYGDMDGVWTDRTVKETRASNPRNHNVPGDHKFDQNFFPAPLKLMVGRVDLANMPGRLAWGGPPTFPSELELLRNYLNKDHKFRTHQLDLPPRALVGDFFGLHDGEAFAASGWRNLAPLLGPDHVSQLPEPGTWISTLSRTPCLWAYGCGPGTYESIAGLGTTDRHYSGTTAELVHHDVKAAFILLYGSWQGDWDAEDDLLRSVLALPTYGLACAWSGRPHWFLHHMGLGETIGFGARLTQNNGPDGLYHTEVNTAAGQIHIALMGDPTLRLQSVAPPSDLTGTTNAAGLTLRWTASDDSVLGYHVYRAASPDGPFTRLTPSPVAGTSCTIASAEGAANYMVRAIKLETSASGTYFNLSQGAFPEPAAGANSPSAPLARHAPSPSAQGSEHPAAGAG